MDVYKNLRGRLYVKGISWIYIILIYNVIIFIMCRKMQWLKIWCYFCPLHTVASSAVYVHVVSLLPKRKVTMLRSISAQEQFCSTSFILKRGRMLRLTNDVPSYQSFSRQSLSPIIQLLRLRINVFLRLCWTVNRKDRWNTIRKADERFGSPVTLNIEFTHSGREPILCSTVHVQYAASHLFL